MTLTGETPVLPELTRTHSDFATMCYFVCLNCRCHYYTEETLDYYCKRINCFHHAAWCYMCYQQQNDNFPNYFSNATVRQLVEDWIGFLIPAKRVYKTKDKV